MTQDETRNWFLTVAKDKIEDNTGLFCTFYYVYEDEYDEYSFEIGYTPYSCGVYVNSCDECPYRTQHGDCGSYHLYINDDGTISYEGKTYSENEFDELLNQFY